MPVSMLDNITSGLFDAFDTMLISNGYNYDVTGGYGVQYQQEDFNKAQFPLYNVYMLEENSMDEAVYPNMNSFRNTVLMEIHCYNKLSSESSNSTFDIDKILNYMLHDIKKMIGSNRTLGSTCESIFYKRSERVDSGGREDIMLPKKLIITAEINYSQDDRTPSVAAYC